MADASLGIHCQDCVQPDKSELVIRFYLQSLARELLPGEKVGECMRTIAPYKSNVEITKRVGARRAHYRNLVVCSRIWQCAVCASTITEKRRLELTDALAKSELFPVLLTYTLQHKKSDPLKESLSALLSAYRSLKSGRNWQEFTEEYSWVGSVRSLEVTHGANGWHPHVHELALLRIPITGAIEHGMSAFLKERWRDMVNQKGYGASLQHGADVRTEDHEIREYVAKFGKLPEGTRWTVEHEVTKSPSKRGKLKGNTPMQLLWDYGQGDKRAGVLFIEYTRAFKGRNQLVWSRGLRAQLGLMENLSDEDITQNEAENGHVLATLSRSDWKQILSLKHRAQLIEFASTHSEAELADYLNEILYVKAESTPV